MSGARLVLELCGRFADPLGPRVELRMEDGGCTAAELVALAASQHPALAPLLGASRVHVCVNEAIVPASAPVHKGDRVALFPPVSGG